MHEVVDGDIERRSAPDPEVEPPLWSGRRSRLAVGVVLFVGLTGIVLGVGASRLLDERTPGPDLAWLVDPVDGPAADGSSGSAGERRVIEVEAAEVGAASPTAAPDATADGQPTVEPERWAPLDLFPVVDPRDHGAVGDGVADDTEALRRTVASLPASGGLVHLADGLTFRTSDTVIIDTDHVKWWSPNGGATLVTGSADDERSQAVICRDVVGCGFFGVRFRSLADRRLTALEDSQIVADDAEATEVVGVEIEGSASAALFFYGRSRESYVEGNYLHDNWSDGVHFTNGSRGAWVWDNVIHNPVVGGVVRGDDGIACVTYGSDSHCGEMEWWHNRHLGSGWGRGYAVVGGVDVAIHHNFVREVAAAGILVASEPSYDTPGSRGVTIEDNVVYRSSHTVPHPGILVSGLSGPIEDVTLRRNLVVDTASGEAYRREGETAGVDEASTTTSADRLPSPVPTADSTPRLRDTSVLRTRDLASVAPGLRDGLNRIHVRLDPVGGGFQQRFEWVVEGPGPAIDVMVTAEPGAEVVHRTELEDGRTVAVILAPRPVTLAEGVRGLGFEELRAGDRAGYLAPVWAALDGGLRPPDG